MRVLRNLLHAAGIAMVYCILGVGALVYWVAPIHIALLAMVAVAAVFAVAFAASPAIREHFEKWFPVEIDKKGVAAQQQFYAAFPNRAKLTAENGIQSAPEPRNGKTE
jgi:cell division protein FtsW (lipid II flippase)